MARQPMAWGETLATLKPENLLRARRFHEAWEENAPWCEPEGHAHPHEHEHDGHGHDHAHTHGRAHGETVPASGPKAA
jgi:zinc/manganese transport system ATP-binding protein